LGALAQNEADIRKRLSWKKIMVPVVIGFLAAGGLLWYNLTRPTFVIDTENGTHAWVDINERGVPDFSEPEEFVEAEDGTYRLTTARELIGSYQWKSQAIWALLGALLMVVLRDVGYIYRIRVLTD
jgi:hypothetical protein